MGAMTKHPDPISVTDLERLRRRSPAAVERWFLNHADGVYTFVFYRVGGDDELAAEVVQDTFVTALDRIDDYDPERGGMSTWLALTARNCIRAALTRSKRHRAEAARWQAIDESLLAAYREMERSPLPDEIIEKQETADLVRMTLAHLPEDYREALTRRYCRQESLRQIAASRGVTDGAAKSLLHRARSAFRAAFLTLASSLDDRPTSREVLP
jgi:RNA polymerase sigma-70 factor (ECF subfamily)